MQASPEKRVTLAGANRFHPRLRACHADGVAGNWLLVECGIVCRTLHYDFWERQVKDGEDTKSTTEAQRTTEKVRKSNPTAERRRHGEGLRRAKSNHRGTEAQRNNKKNHSGVACGALPNIMPCPA